MQRIASDRGHVYAFGGYVYRQNRRVDQTIYYKCINNECYGRALVYREEPPISAQPHSHPADEGEVEIYLFKEECKRMLRENPRLNPQVVFNTASERFPRAAVRLGYYQLRSSLYRTRQAGLPPIPHTIEELYDTLSSDQWANLNSLLGVLGEQQQQPFMAEVLGGGEAGWVAGIYFSGRAATALQTTQRLHIDATFKTVPANFDATQLLTLHGEHMGYIHSHKIDSIGCNTQSHSHKQSKTTQQDIY